MREELQKQLEMTTLNTRLVDMLNMCNSIDEFAEFATEFCRLHSYTAVELGKFKQQQIEEYKRYVQNIDNITVAQLVRQCGIGFCKASKIIQTLLQEGYIKECVDDSVYKHYKVIK